MKCRVVHEMASPVSQGPPSHPTREQINLTTSQARDMLERIAAQAAVIINQLEQITGEEINLDDLEPDSDTLDIIIAKPTNNTHMLLVGQLRNQSIDKTLFDLLEVLPADFREGP